MFPAHQLLDLDEEIAVIGCIHRRLLLKRRKLMELMGEKSE